MVLFRFIGGRPCRLDDLFEFGLGHIAAEVVDRVDVLAPVDYLVVQVRSGRASGAADLSDQLAALDFLSRRDEYLAQVRVTGLITEAVVDQHLQSVSAHALVIECDRAVSGRVDRIACPSAQIDALMSRDASRYRMHARAERADVSAQVPPVDRPDRGDRVGHQLLAFGHDLELVERFRLLIQQPRHPVQLEPRTDHLRGVRIVLHAAVFRGGVGRVDAVHAQRVDAEQRAVDPVVPVAQLVEFGGRRSDFVAEHFVLEHQFVVSLADTIHFRSIEKEREQQVGDRGQNESDQYFPQDAVEPDAQRDGDHLVGQRLRIEFVSFFRHFVNSAPGSTQN